jgi:hypothetical protein
MSDFCPVPHIFTISNTSNVPLTWHVSTVPAFFALTPLGSTLAVGGTIDVSVTSKARSAVFTLEIVADVAPSQSVQLQSSLLGYLGPVVSDVDVGNVPVGASSSVFIPAAGDYPGVALGSSLAAFQLNFLKPSNVPGGFGWTLTFSPTVAGLQQSTLTFFSTAGALVCPPNTFVAKGVGLAP